jgi:CIC family chloride channel protein
LLAVVINKGLFAIEGGFRRLPVNPFWLPAIGAFGFACIGVAVPRSLGVGYDQIGDVLNGRLAVGALAVLALAKLASWWIALASGTSGGTLAPLLLISGSFGALVGHLAQSIPGAHFSPGAFALVAMAATFGASTRAMFTSIIFLFELTRDYNSIIPLMLATALAVLVASLLTHESIMTEKLTRRGLRVPSDYHVDALRTTTVGAVMSTDVETISSDAVMSDVAKRFQVKGHSAFPVVDDGGRCVGVIARDDVLDEDRWNDETAVTEVMASDIVSVAPNDTVSDALERMLQEDVEHLPVIDAERLVGICTRTDVMRARRAQHAHEQPEPGWLQRPRRVS